MNKIATMTPCLNEEATIGFVIGAALADFDLCIVIDNGSVDRTVPLLRHLFPGQISSGKLLIEEIGDIKGQMYIARRKALDICKVELMDYVIKADADDVMTRDGAINFSAYLRAEDLNKIHLVSTITRQTYQYEAENLREWLHELEHDCNSPRDSYSIFYELRGKPLDSLRYSGSYIQGRAYRVRDAIASGQFSDEGLTGLPENIHHSEPGQGSVLPEEIFVHYGWSRPMDRKRQKVAMQYPEDHPLRKQSLVDWAHKDPAFTKFDTVNMGPVVYGRDAWPNGSISPFSDHPQAVRDLIHQVSDYLLTCTNTGGVLSK